MSTLTVHPSASIVAPLLANWLLDLLPPGRLRRISTMLPRRLDAERNLSTIHPPRSRSARHSASNSITCTSTLGAQQPAAHPTTGSPQRII
jgi:hypothetical protein